MRSQDYEVIMATTGGESIYGEEFEDANLILRHTGMGVLSMGNALTDAAVKITGIPEHDTHGNFIHLDTITNGWKSNIFKRIH